MKKNTVIIGGGIAGLWCARELSRLGLESLIVEKASFPGGHVARYGCKATDRCRRCGACILEDVLHGVWSSDRITYLGRTDVSRVGRENGRFSFALARRPPRIDPEKCNDCAECLDVCPVTGALARSPMDNRIILNEDACLFFKEGACRACMDSCPERAVDLDGPPEELLLEAGSVVLACGFQAFDPLEKPRFGHGRIPGVITGLELDSMLRADGFTAADGDRPVRSTAFIQCVGSRDAKIGRNYCSRICCGYALRLARLLRRRFSGLEPSMFYMDIQSFDRDFERRLREARKEVRLVRAIPAEVRTGPDGRPELVYHGPDDKRVLESFDLVVLSVGISPNPSTESVGELLGVSANQDGFLGRDGEEVLTDSKGVFVSGAVQGPKSIEETVSHAIRTAGAVASFLGEARTGENQ